jgi:hypothetical protein
VIFRWSLPTQCCCINWATCWDVHSSEHMEPHLLQMVLCCITRGKTSTSVVLDIWWSK